MSASKENRTFRIFNSIDRLNKENSFKTFGSTKNIFKPKTNLFKNDYSQDLNSSRQRKLRNSIDFDQSKKEKILNNLNNIYSANAAVSSKQLKKKFSLFHKKKDLFNDDQDKEKPKVDDNEVNKNNIEEKPKTYSNFTNVPPKIKKFRTRFENRIKEENEKNEQSEKKIENNEKKEKISNNDLMEYYEENNSNVIKNFTYKENQNLNYRAYMEDKGVSVLNLNGDPDKALFCLFDGHGGEDVSKYLQNNFIKEFKEMMPFDDVKTSLSNLFLKIDSKITELELFEIGAAACIIYITKENGQRCLYSANVGDTRSVLISKNEYKRLSYDHRADDPEENKRIVKDGGIVFGGRVYGSLMLGRAFGDCQLKTHGVICQPHITRINITDNDKFVVLATDGIWDTVQESEVLDLSKKYDDSKEFCDILINKAMNKGSMDNISCFVINL